MAIELFGRHVNSSQPGDATDVATFRELVSDPDVSSNESSAVLFCRADYIFLGI